MGCTNTPYKSYVAVETCEEQQLGLWHSSVNRVGAYLSERTAAAASVVAATYLIHFADEWNLNVPHVVSLPKTKHKKFLTMNFVESHCCQMVVEILVVVSNDVLSLLLFFFLWQTQIKIRYVFFGWVTSRERSKA